MLKIRLQRTGRKNRPAYRVVVCEHTAPIKGAFIENVGHYDPLKKECLLKQERIDYWKSVGAKASETVESLIEKGGKVEQKTRNRIGKRKKEKEEALKAETEAKKTAEKEAKSTEEVANKSEEKDEIVEEKVVAKENEEKKEE